MRQLRMARGLPNPCIRMHGSDYNVYFSGVHSNPWDLVFLSRIDWAWRRFSLNICPGPGESRRGYVSLKSPAALAINVLFWFFHIPGIYFLISTQILNFERSFSLSLGPQSSLVPPCKIDLEGSANKSRNSKIWTFLFYIKF
jgi:hypothetical protein